MATPARQATFDTVELLEQILSELSAPTILTSLLRVSQTWRAVIDNSPTIQAKLWLRPQGGNVSSPLRTSNASDRANGDNNAHMIRALNSGVPVYSGSFEINTLFLDVLGQSRRHPASDRPQRPVTSYRLAHGRLVQLLFANHQPSVDTIENPSWLAMQVTEPPITTAWVEVFISRDWILLQQGEVAASLSLPIAATVRNAGGVTFGAINDAANALLALPHFSRTNGPIVVRTCFNVDNVSNLPIPRIPAQPERLRRPCVLSSQKIYRLTKRHGKYI